MKGTAIHYRSVILISVLVLAVVALTECVSNTDPENVTQAITKEKNFAGSASCAGCHKDIYERHVHTAHFNTSAIATEKNILGSFDSTKNTFQFSTGGLVKMEKRNGGLYQVAYTHGVEKLSQRFDIVTGSGKKGQTYLSWSGARLFQLPITFFTRVNEWCNSPGNPNKIAVNRPITSRCLECHSTFAEKTSDPNLEPEEYNRSTMILGVDCEKCHGAGAVHVNFQKVHPTDTIAKYIINPAHFTRQQSLDMCALCHGGRLQKIKPSFEFTAGDKLSDFFLIDAVAKDAADIDVHGNQYGLLAASKCFRNSNTMTCMTCHSPHDNESGNAALFSQHCLNCHGSQQANAVLCKLTPVLGSKLNSQCTNCHMPEQPSKAIAVLLQGDTSLTAATMHTHLIKNYPVQTNKILDFIKNPAFNKQ